MHVSRTTRVGLWFIVKVRMVGSVEINDREGSLIGGPSLLKSLFSVLTALWLHHPQYRFIFLDPSNNIFSSSQSTVNQDLESKMYSQRS